MKQRLAWLLPIGAAAGALLVFAPTINVGRVQAGVFRNILSEHRVARDFSLAGLMLFREGLSSTVSVFRTPDATFLNLNGKTDASTGGDLGTQYLLGHLPLFLADAPRRVNIIGYGSGGTVRAVATHPVEHIDVVELEPAVLEADPFFHSINDQVLRDPRVRLHVEDGRTFLRYNAEPYDVIISEPSNPWIAGIGALFSREYYAMAASRLRPGGIFCQWIQRYEVSTETLNTMLQTLADVFPHVHIFMQRGDLICVASQQPIRGNPERYSQLFARDELRANLARVNLDSPPELFSGYLAGFPQEQAAYASRWRNTDDNLWLELRAPMEMYQGVWNELTPVAPREYLARCAENFFPGADHAKVALEMSQALVSENPGAVDVLRGMRDTVADPGARSMLDVLGQQAQRRLTAWIERDQQVDLASTLLDTGGDPKQAIALLTPYLGVTPANAFVHRLLAIAFEREEQWQDALHHCREAIRLNPMDYLALRIYGSRLLILGDQPAGEAALREALKINPHDVITRANLINNLRTAGRRAEADALDADGRRVLSGGHYRELAAMLVK